MSESSRPSGTVTGDIAAEPTPFDNVDVEEDVGRDGAAPSGETLTDEEIAEIEKQIEEMVAAHRGANENISVDPEDVS